MKLETWRGTLNAVLDSHRLSEADTVIYAAIFDAAERGLVCPDHAELNDLADYSSTSSSVTAVRRLEAMGLLIVNRVQKYRIVTITATGKATAPHPAMRNLRPHVPRGSRSPMPTDRKLYRKGRL